MTILVGAVSWCASNATKFYEDSRIESAVSSANRKADERLHEVEGAAERAAKDAKEKADTQHHDDLMQMKSIRDDQLRDILERLRALEARKDR